MSSNQKQTAAGGPQTQRYTSSPYQPIPPVAGNEYEYYRPDQFPVSTPPGTYVPQPPNQGGNQPPSLRGPSGPPNQSSTPPNAAELKVQTLSQPPSLNPMFSTVRPPAGSYYTRAAGPPSQPPRMANHNARPQQPSIYTQAQPQYMHVPGPQVFISSNSVPYPYNQRPVSFVPQVPTYTHIPYQYSTTPTQAQPVSFNYFPPPMMQRTGSIPQQSATNPNSTQNTMPNVPLVPNNPHQAFQRQPQHKRRPKALSVIDPETGADRLQEMFENSSHPPSGESSARQTPQLSAATHSHNKEVQAAFAKQVMQELAKDTVPGGDHPHHHPTFVPSQPQDEHHSDLISDGGGMSVPGGHQANHVVHEQNYGAGPGHQMLQQHPQINSDQVVQSSKLQAEAKEFVLTATTAKETPIVSANIDAVEVTLPNKLPKDRESPQKGRKQRTSDHKDSSKDVTITSAPISKDVHIHSDKDSSISKDEIKPSLELSPSSTATINPSTNSSQVPQVVSKDTPKESIAQGQDKHQRVPQHHQQQPKQRKDSHDCNKGLDRQDSGSGMVAAQPVQDAKSKQNAQRSASKQGAGSSNNNQKTVPQQNNPVLPVPQPQPAKPASKSNKKNELNLKGANKEGTDMDAFNDNLMRQQQEVNSNVIPTQVVNNSDIINANSLLPTANSINPSQTHVADDVVNINIETNKKLDNEVTIKPAEPVANTKPSIKTKVDVTDIIKEKPKNIKPYSNKGQDETDKASIMQSTEKMVQVKNDVNAKTNEISRTESKLPYIDGHWSPANQNGLRKYQRDLLLALKDIPASRITPDNIPDAVMADDRGRLSDGRLSMGGGGGGGRTDFNPSFNTYGRNSSQKGPVTSRLSGSKMDRGKGGKGSTIKAPVKVSISVREEVKLHEAENAWRPARLNRGDFPTDDERQTAELYKRVRGILNKLTPQKFDTLLQQIKTLAIDTSARLQGVIDLVFEKAVDEPNFSVAYASMCGHLALIQVPTSSEDKSDYVNFRKLLITRCQVEFEKQSVDESFKDEKIKNIEACTDPDQRKELEFELEEYLRRVRMKSVGNIRFIGELFKQHMLTQNIMMRCLNILLENKDEESLECLCKLLTTIGKELESKQVSLQQIFNQMKQLADKKGGDHKISSRIRFMLQDVIDLRNSKWVPRRQDVNPKRIDQIQKEAEQEQLNIQMANSVPMTPRKDDRGSNQGSSQSSMNDRKSGRGRNVSDDGWTMMKTKQPFSVSSDKLKAAKMPTSDQEVLGPPSMFKQWNTGAGSHVKPMSQQMSNTANNIYTALTNDDGDRRMNSRPGQRDLYQSKGSSLERGSYKFDSRSGSRSGSQHRSNDSSASSSQRGTPAPSSASLPPPHQQIQRIQQHQQTPVAPVPSATVAAPEMLDLNEDQRLRRITNSLDEYVSSNCTLEEYFGDISCAVPPALFSRMVNDSFLHILEKSQQVRLKTGALFAKLVIHGNIPLEDYCAGLEEILSQADDLKIDIPKIWDYLAEILVDSICEEALPLKRLHKVMSILIEQNQADKVLAPLFKLVISNKGTHFLQNQWQLSHLQLSDFMEQSRVDAFIRDNQFEFLLGGATPVGINQLPFDEIHTKLLSFLRNNRSIDDIRDWVTANVGDEGMKENKFVRALATAIFEDSVNEHLKLVSERLEQHTNLLLKYVDNNPGFELECLYALQAFIHQKEHPQGLLLQICDRLYDLGTFSQESFIAWDQSQDPAEQEGKGVALKQLTSFFCQLKENDEDDGSTGSDPDVEE